MIVDTTLTKIEQDIMTADVQEQLRKYQRNRPRTREADGKYADDYNEVLYDLNFAPCHKCLSDFRLPYWGIVQAGVVFERWQSNADRKCSHCFGMGYVRETKDSKKYTLGEPSIQCKCGEKRTFLLPLAGEEDEYVYCSCGRYIGCLFQDGSLVTY